MVYIADEATAKYISQVLTNLDRPKPQVLIKVVFIEVYRNAGLDFGVEGSFTRTSGNSWQQRVDHNYTVLPTYGTAGAAATSFKPAPPSFPR